MNRLEISNNLFKLQFISISIIIVLSSACLGWAAANNMVLYKNSSKFSFNFQNEPFDSVCKTISQATGYKINFDDNFSGLPITAAFEETTAFGALKKVLRMYNHSLVINEEKNLIEVFLIPDGKLSNGEHLATLPSPNQEGGAETYDEGNHKAEDYDEIATAESMEAYAQEYIMQTAAGEDTEMIESADENAYAEEYIKSLKNNDSPSIVAESIEAYAQEYIMQTTAGKEMETIQAADINAYAEAYINRTTSKNDDISSAISANDINEYANEYIRRQLEENFEN